MVNVYALKHVAYPRQLCQSAITYRPVGQQSRQRGEEAEALTAHRRIGRQEGRHHYIGAIFVYGGERGVEGFSCQGGALRIQGACIALLHALAELVETVAEALERCRVITLLGIAHTLKGAAQRQCGH